MKRRIIIATSSDGKRHAFTSLKRLFEYSKEFNMLQNGIRNHIIRKKCAYDKKGIFYKYALEIVKDYTLITSKVNKDRVMIYWMLKMIKNNDVIFLNELFKFEILRNARTTRSNQSTD